MSTVTIGLRPQSFTVNTDGPTLSMTVVLVEELGADTFVYGNIAGDDSATDKLFVIRFDGRLPPSPKDTLKVSPSTTALHVFHPESGLRII